MNEEWQVAQVCEGVEIHFNKSRFEPEGVPLSVAIGSDNLRLSFDLNVHVTAGDQDSKVENILTLKSV